MNNLSQLNSIDIFYDNLEKFKVRSIFKNENTSEFIFLTIEEAEGLIGAIDDYDDDYIDLNNEFLNNSIIGNNTITTQVEINTFLKAMKLSYHNEKILDFINLMIKKEAIWIEISTLIK